MIHGDGVMSKYNVIIAGRQQELYRGIPASQREQKHDELAQFIAEVRACTHEQFEEWYQLYQGDVKLPERRKRFDPNE